MSSLHAWLEFQDKRGEIQRLPIGEALDLTAQGVPGVTFAQEGQSFIVRETQTRGILRVNDRPTREAQLTNLDTVVAGKFAFTFHASYLPVKKLQTAAPPRLKSHDPLFPWDMVFASDSFWKKALAQPLFHPGVSGLFSLTAGIAFAAIPLSADKNGAALLAAILILSTLLFVFVSMAASVFCAAEKLGDAVHFAFYNSPFLLAGQILFLLEALNASWRPEEYFAFGLIPAFFVMFFLGWQAQQAFGASVSRTLSFGALVAIPWYLLMTGLMFLLI